MPCLICEEAGFSSIPPMDGRREESERFPKSCARVAALREGWRMKRLSIPTWYRILRVHHKWTIFQAIRYALRLAR